MADTYSEGELLVATGMPSVTLLLCNFLIGRRRLPMFELAIFLGTHYLAMNYPGTLALKVVIASAVLVFSGLLLRHAASGREKEEPPRTLSIKEEQFMLIDLFRGSVIVMVNICTFACDFNHFPARFLKTKTYGLSLMDVGVSSFLMNSGFLGARKNAKKSLQRIVPIALLGGVRLFVIRGCGYSCDLTEYGMHLNFYFVSLIVDLICSLMSWAPSLLTGVLLCALHELVLLTTDLPNVVFGENRSSFFLANKEGLIAIIPYTATYFISKSVGMRIFAPIPYKSRLRYLISYTALFFAVYYFYSSVHVPSRRLGNASFVFFMLALNMLHVTLLHVLIGLSLATKMHTMRYTGRKMGTSFLISNVLILAGNCLFNWKRLGPVSSNIVNAVYMFLTFGAPYFIENSAVQRTGEKARPRKGGGR